MSWELAFDDEGESIPGTNNRNHIKEIQGHGGLQRDGQASVEGSLTPGREGTKDSQESHVRPAVKWPLSCPSPAAPRGCPTAAAARDEGPQEPRRRDPPPPTCRGGPRTRPPPSPFRPLVSLRLGWPWPPSRRRYLARPSYIPCHLSESKSVSRFPAT